MTGNDSIDEDTAAANPVIGTRYPRRAVLRPLNGRGRYVDDIALPRMLHAAFVRSPHARAGIVSIATGEARRLRGVAAIFTGHDLAPHCQGWRGDSRAFPEFKPPLQRAIAVDHCYYQGEAVAIVLADSRAVAEDAAECVDVEWDPQTSTPHLPDVAMAAPAHPELASNAGFRAELRTGDFQQACQDAAFVIAEELKFGRHTGVPLETRGLIADYNPADGTLAVYHSHQTPNEAQAHFAEVLGLPQERIRVICPDVGGGFGVKLHRYPDEMAVAAASKMLGRPVKFIADRFESFMTDVHAREHRVTARLAVAADGTMLGFGVDDLYGMGAYSISPRTSASCAMLAVRTVGVPYRAPHFHAKIAAVFQNRTPSGQIRAVGAPIGCAVTERLVDKAAQRLGMDPAEFRRRNLVPSSAMPVKASSGMDLIDLSQHAALDAILNAMRWDDLKAERDRLRRQGIFRGIGLAAFVEPTAAGAMANGPSGQPVVAMESITVKVEPSGGLRCLTGTTDQGQGTSSGIQQVVAAAFGVDLDEVVVYHGDTATIPPGGGAWSGRGMAIGGEAAWRATRLLRDQVLATAATLLQTTADELKIVKGRILNRRTGEQHISMKELAEIVYYRSYLLPPDVSPQFAVTHQYRRARDTFIPSNGFQASYVEVDVETGIVTPLMHWVVEDCGRIVNPLLVDEQIRGGVVQGIGAALYENCRYDESGQLLSTTLADYLLPTPYEMPDIDVRHVETAYSGSELGAKGAGEAGTCGASAAVLNAVNDALLPLGVAVGELPMTPPVVLAALGTIRSQP